MSILTQRYPDIKTRIDFTQPIYYATNNPISFMDNFDLRVNENNKKWKGNNVGYRALHAWVRRKLPKPKSCQKCHHTSWLLDLSNISGNYLRDLSDWEYLCRKCHVNKDLKKEKPLHILRRNRYTNIA